MSMSKSNTNVEVLIGVLSTLYEMIVTHTCKESTRTCCFAEGALNIKDATSSRSQFSFIIKLYEHKNSYERLF